MVYPDSHRISRVLWYSGTFYAAIRFRLQDFHLLWSVFPNRFSYLITDRIMKALQPHQTEVRWFGLYPFRSPLLWASQLISFPSGTEMFHFPEFAPFSLCIQLKDDRFLIGRVSPFGHPRLKVCLPTPRGLS